MGGHHPAEYLAESIINPSAVLVEGPGYIGGDGRSVMPASLEMTLAQLTNLVAYLKTLGGSEAHASEPPREQIVGGYRVRLAYKKAADAGDHAHHGHTGAMAMGQSEPRLLVFLADPATDEPIPYVSVSAKIQAQGKLAQTVKLWPSLGKEGFHYSARITLPEGTDRITLSLGPTSMRLDGSAPQGLRQTQTVSFDWK